jgi:hypothetical protein
MAVAQPIAARCCVECGTNFEVPIRCGRPRQRCFQCSTERLNHRRRPRVGRGRDKPCRCVVCGSDFLSAKSTTTVCGAACRWRRDNPDTRRRSDRSAASPKNRDYICEGCSATFRPKRSDRLRFCSRECAFENGGAGGTRRVWPSCKVRFSGCELCAALFACRSAARFCGATCRTADAAARLREKHQSLAALRPPAKCRRCGDGFLPTHGRVFCSTKCRRATHRGDHGTHRRRARNAGVVYEPIDRLKVFNRDGWRCQVCGAKTPKRSLGTTRPDAPELDHRIPFALKGSHTWANVQCCCRRCNGTKAGSKIEGQLNLFPVAA